MGPPQCVFCTWSLCAVQSSKHSANHDAQISLSLVYNGSVEHQDIMTAVVPCAFIFLTTLRKSVTLDAKSAGSQSIHIQSACKFLLGVAKRVNTFAGDGKFVSSIHFRFKEPCRIIASGIFSSVNACLNREVPHKEKDMTSHPGSQISARNERFTVLPLTHMVSLENPGCA